MVLSGFGLCRIEGKRSQLYLLTAIFLLLLVFLMMQLPARTEPGTGEAFSVYNNYISEAPVVINSALFSQRNITEDMDEFTEDFIIHAYTKNINLSILYIIGHDDFIAVSNRMSRSVNITTSEGESVIGTSDTLYLDEQELVNIEFDTIEYPFRIDTSRTDIKILFSTEDEGNKEVYTYD
ncbi:hypothetical protein GF345_03040 [Candidatus Woesearchaeota archaeon]|nr:hypothetical protein [Candidatus Woesearchaeota archaeon]